jgi:hypothetical protein
MKRLILDRAISAEILTESVGDEKRMYIAGNFLMHSQPNRNKRIYDGEGMRSAVKKYTEEFVNTQRALGEMNHPKDRLTVDPERACILTTELHEDGNYYHGKAKVLSTPLGKVLEALLKDGVKIGVSSRGVGSTSKRGDITHVGKDFQLAVAADVVFDPSVGDAFVEHLMEEKEYIFINGILVDQDLYEAKQTIKRANASKLQEAKLQVFQDFLTKIQG